MTENTPKDLTWDDLVTSYMQATGADVESAERFVCEIAAGLIGLINFDAKNNLPALVQALANDAVGFPPSHVLMTLAGMVRMPTASHQGGEFLLLFALGLAKRIGVAAEMVDRLRLLVMPTKSEIAH